MDIIYIYTADIEGIPGFIFRRVRNKFHLGLFIIVYFVPSFRTAPAPKFSEAGKINVLIEAQMMGSFDNISGIQFTSNWILFIFMHFITNIYIYM